MIKMNSLSTRNQKSLNSFSSSKINSKSLNITSTHKKINSMNNLLNESTNKLPSLVKIVQPQNLSFNIKLGKYPPSKYKYLVKNDQMNKSLISKLYNNVNNKYSKYKINVLKANYDKMELNSENDIDKKKTEKNNNLLIKNYYSNDFNNNLSFKKSKSNLNKTYKNCINPNMIKKDKNKSPLILIKKKFYEKECGEALNRILCRPNIKNNTIKLIKLNKQYLINFEEKKSLDLVLSKFILKNSYKKIISQGTQTYVDDSLNKKKKK